MSGNMVAIESMKLTDRPGKIRAFVSIVIARRIRIADIWVIQEPGESAWVALPKRKYESKGKPEYSKIVELLDAGLKEEVFDTVLREFSKMTAASTTTSDPSDWFDDPSER